MRDYVPLDDGKEPTDFDEYFDIPAETDEDFADRVYIKIERDPKRAAILQQRQKAVIMDVLRWVRDNRAQLQDQGHTLPEPPDDDQPDRLSSGHAEPPGGGQRDYSV